MEEQVEEIHNLIQKLHLQGNGGDDESGGNPSDLGVDDNQSWIEDENGSV